MEKGNNALLDRIRSYADELRFLRASAGDTASLTQEVLLFLARKYEKKVTIAALEEVVKKFKAREEEVSSRLLPEAMDECGMTEFTDSHGTSIIVDDKVRGSISQRNSWNVYDALVGRHMDEGLSHDEAERITREELSWTVTSDDPAAVDQISHLSHEVKLKPHPSRVSKLVREWLDSGKPIPEGVTWFQQRFTKIKEKKDGR